MSSRAPPPDEPDDSKAGVTPSAEPTPGSDPLKTLPASALIVALVGRIVVSTRRAFDGMRGAAPPLATVAADDATMPDRSYGPGFHSPFRLFWFRF